jgi:hypothetical protein
MSRLQVGRALGQTELCPPALDGNSVLIVRRLRDPMPGSLRLRYAEDRPSPVWQEALRAEVERRMRGAARPARGAIPAAAEAVLFADRSELLACLARDWCEGAIAERWWWRALLRDPDSARTAVAEWLRSPEYAPAALQQLATIRQAVSFVQRIDGDSVGILLERVIERFGLAQLRPLLIGSESTSARLSDGAQVVVRDSIPWLPWVPETAEPTLTRKHADLLGIALLLQRAPRVARSVALVEAIQHSRRGVPPENGEPMLPAQELAASGNEMEPDRALAVSREGAQPVAARRQDRGRGESPIPGGERDSIPVSVTHDSPPAGSTRRPSIAESVADPPPATAPTAEYRSELDLPEARSVETDYGGALFLINLGLFLDLYSDFSQAAKPGIELPIWDFVALLGEALAGPAIRHDPLWPLLAELAGREPAQEPGRHFSPPPEWRMPENWLTSFAAAAWEWCGRECRLQVRHPGGFVVLDVAVPERNYIDVLDAELAPYRTADRCAGIARRAPRAGGLKRAPIRRRTLRRWCSWLLPYVHARLEAALGVTAAEAGKLLCACPARLRMSATHLDAHFALADLPIEVRIAALDRDPGWVPAAGRYIKFHFD